MLPNRFMNDTIGFLSYNENTNPIIETKVRVVNNKFFIGLYYCSAEVAFS